MRAGLTIAALLALAIPAGAQTQFPSPDGHNVAPGTVPLCINSSNFAVPCSSLTPLAVTGGITTGTPGTPASVVTGPNVVTVQGVSGMVPIAIQSGQCPPNPISKIASAWPFCK